MKFQARIALTIGTILIAILIFFGFSEGDLIPKDTSPDSSRAAVHPIHIDTVAEPSPKHSPIVEVQPAQALPVKPGGGTIANLLKEPHLLKLTTAQLSNYLSKNQRNPEALISAFRLTGDINLLREAATTYPDDPQVSLEVALKSENPEERRRGIDAFRQADPDNALGDYLSALDHFRAGRNELAFNDLSSAASKTSLSDYALIELQSSEEAYMSAGYSIAKAKAAAMLGLQRKQIEPLSELAKKIRASQNHYIQMGDIESAQELADVGIKLGRQAQGGDFLIDEVYGAAIEQQFLGHLDPATRQARLNEIQTHKSYIHRLANTNSWMEMNDEEVVAFFDRQKLYGEREALLWLHERHGKK